MWVRLPSSASVASLMDAKTIQVAMYHKWKMIVIYDEDVGSTPTIAKLLGRT